MALYARLWRVKTVLKNNLQVFDLAMIVAYNVHFSVPFLPDYICIIVLWENNPGMPEKNLGEDR